MKALLLLALVGCQTTPAPDVLRECRAAQTSVRVLTKRVLDLETELALMKSSPRSDDVCPALEDCD